MAGAFMGIPCLDHIIVGAYGKEYHSMRENNTVDFNPGMEEAGKEMDSMVAETAAAYAPAGPVFDSPFGNVPIAEVLAASEAARKKQERPARRKSRRTCGLKARCPMLRSISANPTLNGISRRN